MYTIGQEVNRVITTNVKKERKAPQKGIITYINQANRWYEVTFKLNNGHTIRECYFFDLESPLKRVLNTKNLKNEVKENV